MSTSGTYYLNAPSLTSATSIYTDSALTTVAADGWYSDGTTIRELVSGVLTNVISSCAPCATPCSITPINIVQDKSFFEMNQDLGTTSLDVGAVVVEIVFNGAERPLGMYLAYDGVIYNALSSQNFGFVQGPVGEPIYIGNSAFDCGVIGVPPFFHVLYVYAYNVVTNTFYNTGQITIIKPTIPQLALSAGATGKYVMVIPKPNAVPSNIYFQGILCCDSNNVSITINCPKSLPSFTSTENKAVSLDACGAGTVREYYVADVNGTVASGGFLGLYDWVFADSIGQAILPDGYYRSPAVQAPDTYFQVQDGVIIAFGACGAVPLWVVTYEAENAISGVCSGNVVDLSLKISQPPTPAYIDVSAPATGTANVPEGITHVQLEMDWLESIPNCGQIKMVIEKNGVVVAYKTLTPTGATIETLEVDFILEDDVSIYGYVTLA